MIPDFVWRRQTSAQLQWKCSWCSSRFEVWDLTFPGFLYEAIGSRHVGMPIGMCARSTHPYVCYFSFAQAPPLLMSIMPHQSKHLAKKSVKSIIIFSLFIQNFRLNRIGKKNVSQVLDCLSFDKSIVMKSDLKLDTMVWNSLVEHGQQAAIRNNNRKTEACSIIRRINSHSGRAPSSLHST